MAFPRCFIALKRNNDNRRKAFAFLKKMKESEVTAKGSFQTAAVSVAKETEQKLDERVPKEDAEKAKQTGKTK